MEEYLNCYEAHSIIEERGIKKGPRQDPFQILLEIVNCCFQDTS